MGKARNETCQYQPHPASPSRPTRKEHEFATSHANPNNVQMRCDSCTLRSTKKPAARSSRFRWPTAKHTRRSRRDRPSARSVDATSSRASTSRAARFTSIIRQVTRLLSTPSRTDGLTNDDQRPHQNVPASLSSTQSSTASPMPPSMLRLDNMCLPASKTLGRASWNRLRDGPRARTKNGYTGLRAWPAPGSPPSP